MVNAFRPSSSSSSAAAPPLRTPSEASSSNLNEERVRNQSLDGVRSLSSAIADKLHFLGASCFSSRRDDGRTSSYPGRGASEIRLLPGGAGEQGSSRRRSISPVVCPDGKPKREIDTTPEMAGCHELIPSADKLHFFGASCFSTRRDDGRTSSYPGRGASEIRLLPGAAGEQGSSRRRSISPVVCPDGKPKREIDATPEMAGCHDGIPSAEEKVNDTTSKISVEAKGREYTWAQKYRPRTLKEFICNREQAEELHRLVMTQECSHFIFEGPPGVGKKTMVLALLRDIIGPERLKMKRELKRIELKGEHVASIDVNVRKSSQHVEVNLSETHGYEKHVIVALINETNKPLDKPVHCDLPNFRAIVLHEADKLSNDAQHYVCWLMNKYKGCNKIFFCCCDASKLQVIKHLCKIVKLQPPSDNEVVQVLEFIAHQEGIRLPHHLARRIAENSKHNLRQAIRSFEASWKSKYWLEENEDFLTGWEDDIADIAKSIIEEQSPRQLYIIRGKLRKLVEHNVSPGYIFNSLVSELRKNLDDDFQPKVDALYQEYDIWNTRRIMNDVKCLEFIHNHENSGKLLDDQMQTVQHFMRIEEFTAKFMSFYKSFITKGNTKYPSGPVA